MKNATEFIEAYATVDGALDEEEVCYTRQEVDAFVNRQRKAAAADGLRTEVYLQYHGHSPDVVDCSCVQYETDHNPDYTFPESD